MYAATDPVAGNDATAVFALATPAAATAAPFQSITGLLAAMPRFGNNCIFVCLMKPGSYFAPFTLLPDNLIIIGFTDYQTMLFRGSDFTNSAADHTQLGETTVANTSTLGYTVQTNVLTPASMAFPAGAPIEVFFGSAHGLSTGNMVAGRGFTGGPRLANGTANGFWIVNVIDAFTFTLNESVGPPGGDTWSGVGTFVRWGLTDNSGNPVALHGPPGFPTLIGKRFMFDATSPTVALRNASFPIIGYDTQGIIFGNDPGTIAPGDFGRFQEPAVIIGLLETSYGPSIGKVEFAGISAAQIFLAGYDDKVAACEQTLTTSGSLDAGSVAGSISVSSTYQDELGSSRFVGVGMRAVATTPFFTGTVFLSRLYHTPPVITGFLGLGVTTGRGNIFDGYYGQGIVLTDCGGHGGFDASDASFVVNASNPSFMRGPESSVHKELLATLMRSWRGVRAYSYKVQTSQRRMVAVAEVHCRHILPDCSSRGLDRMSLLWTLADTTTTSASVTNSLI